MTSKTANGVVGDLIYCHATKEHMFRVYDANHDFKDYDIRHNDLRVKIIDADAHFYDHNGELTLDHSPATLGTK
jgi:hypothetical protein